MEINSEFHLTEFFKTENRLRRIFILTLTQTQPMSKSWIFHLSYLLSRQVAGEISEDFSAFKCLLIRNILSSLYISTSFDNFLPSSSSLLLVLGTFLDIISSFPLLSTFFSSMFCFFSSCCRSKKKLRKRGSWRERRRKFFDVLGWQMSVFESVSVGNISSRAVTQNVFFNHLFMLHDAYTLSGNSDERSLSLVSAWLEWNDDNDDDGPCNNMMMRVKETRRKHFFYSLTMGNYINNFVLIICRLYLVSFTLCFMLVSII